MSAPISDEDIFCGWIFALKWVGLINMKTFDAQNRIFTLTDIIIKFKILCFFTIENPKNNDELLNYVFNPQIQSIHLLPKNLKRV